MRVSARSLLKATSLLRAEAGATSEKIKHGADGSIYRIHYNRPDKFNAITIPMYATLGEAMRAANEDKNTKFTVFSGEGEYFSAGNDLMTFANLKTREEIKETAEKGAEILREFVGAFIDHNKPLIGLIHGPAFGITVTTLALFDVVYASDKATFQTPFSALGFSPEGCSSTLFPKIFGHAKVIPDAQFAEKTAKLLKQYAEFPADSLRYNKTMIRDFAREDLHRVNNVECDALCERWQSRDCLEAMAKFKARGKK